MSEKQNYKAGEVAESKKQVRKRKKQARKRAEGLWWAGALIWQDWFLGLRAWNYCHKSEMPMRGVGCSSERACMGWCPISTM